MDRQKLKNIGFVSTRIAGTDGVSLEIEKWATVLERNKFNCFYFAGKLDRPAGKCMEVEEAFFEHEAVKKVNGQLFGVRQRERLVTDRIQELKDYLKDRLYEFIRHYQIDLLVPENALTIPMNIPLGLALTEVIAETEIPTIAHHHDFYWERDRFLINAAQDYLAKSFPPDLPTIRHVVINSLASEQLSHRAGISNLIIPNVYNFARQPAALNRDQCTIREEIGLRKDDLFILQPTRIVPRKWIERSIEIVRRMELERPCLVISHASGDEGGEYYQRVQEYAATNEVKILAIDHLIGNNHTGNNKKYSIGDVYQCADLVTYPSGYEGFGNAFLETVYYRKPIVVNRYSIYIADIEPRGFDVIALDGFVSARAVEEIRRVLNDSAYRQQMVDKNYELGRRFYSFEVLEKKLLHLMETFE